MRATFPALTAIRGLAAWWVVVYHFREVLDFSGLPLLRTLAAHGYLAVDLFFIMSGFVIALNYADSLQRPSFRTVLRFLGFRLARIYPLHLVVLAAFLVNPLAIWMLSRSGALGSRYDPGYFLQSLLLIQNWGFGPDIAWNIPAWSISTEWGAYLAFPLVAYGLSRIRSPAQALSALLGALILVTAAGYATGGLGEDIAYAGLLRCLLEFSLGAALFRLHALGAHRLPPGDAMFAAGLALLAAGPVAGWPDYAYGPSAFLLAVLGLLDGRSLSARALAGKTLLYVGEISYSTYLVHYLVKDWSKFLLVNNGSDGRVVFVSYVLATAAASVVLYHLVELPGRRFGRERVQVWLTRRQAV